MKSNDYKEEDEFDKPRIGSARNTARSLLKLAKINTYPIKLVEIAKLIPDLIITGAELEDEISGMQGTYKGISFIQYNAMHSTHRNRFTVAHELGHAVLGHTANGCNRNSFNTRNINEIEANQFAAELLMPLSLLKKALDTITTVDKLSKAFWVSKESMGWRIKDTGLYIRLTSWDSAIN